MAEFNSVENQDWNIVLDLSIVSEDLANNPAFIAAITKQVRDQMTKDVRWMGNLFAKWAQSQPPAPTTRKRAQ
jgi:hypothetical protein